MEAAITKAAALQLRASIERGRLWATDAETAAWLKTETGQRIAALIEKRRKEDVACTWNR